MKSFKGLIALFAVFFSIVGVAKDVANTPDYITAAIADSKRPSSEIDQDVSRKPESVLKFVGVKPNDHVIDLVPGGGYYTRLFSKIVGSKGVVYSVTPNELLQKFPKAMEAPNAIANSGDYKNVVVLQQPAVPLTVPQPVDVVFTSMNYHDYHNPLFGSPDMAEFNKSVFNALKPGGVFVVLDHAATAGSGLDATNTLHRIDPAAAKKEIMAAGFEFVGESKALNNSNDDHTLSVFDKSLRGNTDRFIYKFRRPKH